MMYTVYSYIYKYMSEISSNEHGHLIPPVLNSIVSVLSTLLL